MSETETLLIVAALLSEWVPLIFLAYALYLGLEGSTLRPLNWAYIVLFGAFGTAGYMVLNKPTFDWAPLWATTEFWLSIALLVILIMGTLVFLTAIETQDLDTPGEYFCKTYNRTRDRLR